MYGGCVQKTKIEYKHISGVVKVPIVSMLAKESISRREYKSLQGEADAKANTSSKRSSVLNVNSALGF